MQTQPATAHRSSEQAAPRGAVALRRLAQQQRMSPLARAIAAWEDFKPEFDRLSKLDDEAEDLFIELEKSLATAMEAARKAVPMPPEIQFESDGATKATFEYPDGSTRVIHLPTGPYTPSTPRDLRKACEDRGLSIKGRLKAWRAWIAAQEKAALDAAGDEYLAVREHAAQASERWVAAVAHRRKLAARILAAPIRTPAEAALQLRAYADINEVGEAPYGDAEELDAMLKRALKVLDGFAMRDNVVPLRTAA